MGDIDDPLIELSSERDVWTVEPVYERAVDQYIHLFKHQVPLWIIQQIFKHEPPPYPNRFCPSKTGTEPTDDFSRKCHIAERLAAQDAEPFDKVGFAVCSVP